MSFGETESSMSLPSREDQHLLPKSVFDRPGSDRWNLASTSFPDAGPMVRIRFPPAESQSELCIGRQREPPLTLPPGPLAAPPDTAKPAILRDGISQIACWMISAGKRWRR